MPVLFKNIIKENIKEEETKIINEQAFDKFEPFSFKLIVSNDLEGYTLTTAVRDINKLGNLINALKKAETINADSDEFKDPDGIISAFTKATKTTPKNWRIRY